MFIATVNRNPDGLSIVDAIPLFHTLRKASCMISSASSRFPVIMQRERYWRGCCSRKNSSDVSPSAPSAVPRTAGSILLTAGEAPDAAADRDDSRWRKRGGSSEPAGHEV